MCQCFGKSNAGINANRNKPKQIGPAKHQIGDPEEVPKDDGWDWPWLLYIGTHSSWLGRTEKEFWQFTPRKFFALLQVHVQMEQMKHGMDSKKGSPAPASTGFIDQIPGW